MMATHSRWKLTRLAGKFDDGPSIAERMGKKKVWFHRADNQRLNGWDQMRSRLVGEDNQAMLYFFDSCTDSIRIIPLLQHNEKHLEDIDTDMEDHAGRMNAAMPVCQGRGCQPKRKR